MQLKPVYYIYGTDDYLIEEEVVAIKSGALKGGFASMNCQSFDGKGINATDVITAASTLPAFSDKRVVLVKGQIKAADEKEFLRYIENPAPTTCLVFLPGSEKVSRDSQFIKALSERGYLKECKRLNEAELVSWVKRDAKRQNKDISEGVARKLVDVAGTRLRDIKAELDKLVLYAGENPSITEADVEDSGLDCREETIFGLSDAIGSKDLKKALKIYEKVSSEEPIKVLGAIARQIRILLRIKAYIRKGMPGQKIIQLLGLFPRYAEDYIKRSRKFSEPELQKAIERLSIADIDLKTGRIPEALVLPRLIMELCGQG